jgi:hypothetical protein
MNSNRFLIWPTLLISYAAMMAALAHIFLRNWSAFATFGLLFAILIGAPTLAGYAGYLWCRNLLQGFARVEAAACVLMPVFLIVLAFFCNSFWSPFSCSCLGACPTTPT